MGARFEIETVSRDLIPLPAAAGMLHTLGLSLLVHSVSWAEDWSQIDLHSLLLEDRNSIEALVSQGRIVFVEGTICGAAAGVILRREAAGFVDTIWFDRSLCPFPEGAADSPGAQTFLGRMERGLAAFSRYGLRLGVMGEELCLTYAADLAETIRESANVLRWVCPPQEEAGQARL